MPNSHFHIVLWPPPWNREMIPGRIAAGAYAIAIAPVVVLVSLVVFLSIPFQRLLARRSGPRMSVPDVALVIDHFVMGESGEWDWDDFISAPIDDPRLDSIRERCARLDEEFRPTRSDAYCGDEGLEVLRQFVRELRRSDG